jgi:hypothetical protein
MKIKFSSRNCFKHFSIRNLFIYLHASYTGEESRDFCKMLFCFCRLLSQFGYIRQILIKLDKQNFGEVDSAVTGVVYAVGDRSFFKNTAF